MGRETPRLPREPEAFMDKSDRANAVSTDPGAGKSGKIKKKKGTLELQEESKEALWPRQDWGQGDN